MTETFLPVISMLSSCASFGLTFQTMPPSPVRLHRVWAERLKASATNETMSVGKLFRNLMREVCGKTGSVQVRFECLPSFAGRDKRRHQIMAEFKFPCPHCKQQIQCDTTYVGSQIAC